MRQRTSENDDDFETLADGRRVLRSGRALHVPMWAADGVAADQVRRRKWQGRDPQGRETGTEEEQETESRHYDHLVTNAAGRRGARQRSGYRITADTGSMQDARAEAYEQYDSDVENAWRSPPSGFGEHGPIGPREGDVCTVRNAEYPHDTGSAGHLRMRGGRLVCVPDNPRSRSDAGPPRSVATMRHDHARAMEDIYREFDEAISSAWRSSHE